MTGTLSPEDYAQQKQIIRQQRMADMLMSQNQQPQGQMVSGRYVAPNIFQQLQPVANMLTGAYLAKQGDTRATALAEAIRKREGEETQKILGYQFGSPDYKAAEMPQIQRDDLGQIMPPVNPQVGQAPNPQQALIEGLKAQGRTGQMIGQTLLAQKLKPPELINVAQGATVGERGLDGTFKKLYENPKEETPSEAQKNYKLAQIQGYPGSFMDYEKIMHNLKAPRISVGGMGGPIVGQGGEGTFDKKGNFISPNGTPFTPVELRKDREVVTAATLLKKALQNISPEDITASDTILGDVTQSGFKGYAAKQLGLNSVAAQNKINASGIMQILGNLPPGPASDKDISQAKSTFPGYGDSKALGEWIKNTNKMLDDKFNTYQDKYGSMKWYGNTSPMQSNEQTTLQSNAPMYIVNKATGERQMSNDGGKTWSPIK